MLGASQPVIPRLSIARCLFRPHQFQRTTHRKVLPLFEHALPSRAHRKDFVGRERSLLPTRCCPDVALQAIAYYCAWCAWPCLRRHGAGRQCAWLRAPENQRALVAMEPARYFVPPYVGKSGWVGVFIDKRPRWTEVDELVRDAYRRVAPGKLAMLVR